jgi:hypothetical protein
MARAGGRKVGGEVAIDAVAETDQDARGEPRLGLRHCPVQPVRGRAAAVFQRRLQEALRREDTEALGAQRSDCPDPGEVGAIVVRRRRANPAAQLDAVAGHDGRVPRQRGGNNDRRRAFEPHGRRTGPGSKRADALHHGDPGAVTVRDRNSRRSCVGCERAAARDCGDPKCHGHCRPGEGAAPRRPQRDADREEGDGDEANNKWRHHRQRQRRHRCADRQPRRCWHG